MAVFIDIILPTDWNWTLGHFRVHSARVAPEVVKLYCSIVFISKHDDCSCVSRGERGKKQLFLQIAGLSLVLLEAILPLLSVR